jgi:hypothetical protein
MSLRFVRSLWMDMRAWWYFNVARKKTPPSQVRRYLLRRGLAGLKGNKLTLEFEQSVAMAELTAAVDGDFSEMMGDLLEDGMKRLAEIPHTRCVLCKAPIFLHEAHPREDGHYCEGCTTANPRHNAAATDATDTANHKICVGDKVLIHQADGTTVIGWVIKMDEDGIADVRVNQSEQADLRRQVDQDNIKLPEFATSVGDWRN